VFLDANILLYAQDAGSPEKQRRSRDVIARLAESGDGVISTQVMQSSTPRRPENLVFSLWPRKPF